METAKYYAIINGNQEGPMGIDELRYRGITPETPVWKPGMTDWVAASSLPELASILRGNPPTYQPGQNDYGQSNPVPPQPSNGYGQPSNGYGQPSNGYGQPSNGYGQPSNGYGQPSNGYGQSGYYNDNNVMPPKPDNYLAWSIAVTVCCCLAGGIVAIVYSSKVDSKYNSGDYDGALQASNQAKTWCIVSAIAGVITNSLAFLMNLSEIL